MIFFLWRIKRPKLIELRKTFLRANKKQKNKKQIVEPPKQKKIFIFFIVVPFLSYKWGNARFALFLFRFNFYFTWSATCSSNSSFSSLKNLLTFSLNLGDCFVIILRKFQCGWKKNTTTMFFKPLFTFIIIVLILGRLWNHGFHQIQKQHFGQ